MAKDNLKGGDNQRKKMRGYIEQIEEAYDDLDGMKAEYMSDCKSVRQRIRDIIKDAKSDGILPKAIRAFVKRRELQARADNVVVGLDIDEMSQVSDMQLAFELDEPTASKPKNGSEARPQA